MPAEAPLATTHENSRTRGALARGFSFVAWAAALGLLLSLLASRLVGDNFLTLAFLALMVQTFAFHAGLVAAALALVAAALRCWRLAAALVVCVLVTAGPFALRALRAAPVPVDDDATLTILSCNLRYGTADPARLLSWIDLVDPDVILLQEFDHPWPAAARESLAARYPHAWQEPGGVHGQAILARLPFEAFEPDVFGRQWEMASPRATVAHRGRLVDITSVHAYPPMGLALLRAQLDQLDALATQAAARLGGRVGEVEGVVLMGDFNAPWDTNHLRPLARLGLDEAHARVGRGRGATWGPPAGVLSRAPDIRIDHAVYGGALGPAWSVVGPDVGSDHRPIAVGMRWTNEPSSP